MKTLITLLLLSGLFLIACKDENITNNYGPEDWQPPHLEWVTPPESELRGTVGIDILVQDSSGIDSVVLYVDGLRSQMTNQSPYRFEVITDSLEDDDHLLEARAWDEHGNIGVSTILRVIVMNGTPEGPRLIWVPDNYERIQDAINASTHYDAIRVRSGTYYEILNTFGKGIWIESQDGPMTTRINGLASNSVFTISPNDIVGTIRGLWFEGAARLVRYELGGQMNLYNNIFFDDTASSLFFSTYSGGQINNNLFSGGYSVVSIGYHWGTLYNNIIQNAASTALWNAALSENPLDYGYNLLWNNVADYNDRFDPGVGDVYGNPMLNLVTGYLENGSPAIDAGNPLILDLDSSRSDIGPFGGPWAYEN